MPPDMSVSRAQYYDPVPAGGLRRYHRSEQEMAGLFGTETCHPPFFRIPRHAHNLTSFYMVLEGSQTESTGGKERELAACRVVFTPPGEVHSNSFHAAGGRCFLVEFAPFWSDRLAAWNLQLDGAVKTDAGEMQLLATRLYKEFRNADRVSPLSVEGLALEILAAFSRQTENAAGPNIPNWLREARDLLHDRFVETISLSEIAGLVGVHPVHLARAFRRRYGCSLGDYQRRLRVDYASSQLLTTRLPLAQIALAAGFSDQAHFSRVFKSHTGLTPAKFRSGFGPS